MSFVWLCQLSLTPMSNHSLYFKSLTFFVKTVQINSSTGCDVKPTYWIVFWTLIGDLNFVSKSLRNFQSSLKLYCGLCRSYSEDMEKRTSLTNFPRRDKTNLKLVKNKCWVSKQLSSSIPTIQYWRIRMQVWKLILHMFQIIVLSHNERGCWVH